MIAESNEINFILEILCENMRNFALVCYGIAALTLRTWHRGGELVSKLNVISYIYRWLAFKKPVHFEQGIHSIRSQRIILVTAATKTEREALGRRFGWTDRRLWATVTNLTMERLYMHTYSIS